MRQLLFSLALLASPALADDGCHDLWLTRNLVMDRAGYCFGTVLGQAVFDNSDCTGKQASLDAEAVDFVAYIRGLEQEFECRVDTSQPVLQVDDAAFRPAMITLPVRDEFESGCLGWIGQAMPLRSGAGDTAPVVGQISPGAFVKYSYLPVGDWTYVTTWTENFEAITGAGWVPLDATAAGQCRDFAG